MNSISDLITDKAEEMFPENNTRTENELDLEDYSDVAEEKTEDKTETTNEEIKTETEESEQKESSISPTSNDNNKTLDIEKLKTKIYSLKDQLDSVIRLIEGGVEDSKQTGTTKDKVNIEEQENDDRILQGTFDGEKMIGKDGKEYAVAPNYASKSKLVEGDTLKLTITDKGKFIYKQVSPVERLRRVGKLTKDTSGNQWYVQDGDKRYKVLTASVTFYRGVVGDEVVFFIAKGIPNSWAAVDNIVKQTS